MEKIITQEEKINYIYKTLKKNKRNAIIGSIFKCGFRIFLVLYMMYFIKVGLPLLIDSLIPAIPTIGPEGSAIDIDPQQIKSIMSEYFSK